MQSLLITFYPLLEIYIYAIVFVYLFAYLSMLCSVVLYTCVYTYKLVCACALSSPLSAHARSRPPAEVAREQKSGIGIVLQSTVVAEVQQSLVILHLASYARARGSSYVATVSRRVQARVARQPNLITFHSSVSELTHAGYLGDGEGVQRAGRCKPTRRPVRERPAPAGTHPTKNCGTFPRWSSSVRYQSAVESITRLREQDLREVSYHIEWSRIYVCSVFVVDNIMIYSTVAQMQLHAACVACTTHAYFSCKHVLF